MEEILSIQNKNNLTLSAIFHYPGKSIKYPAVIVLHGFTGYKEEEHLVELSHDLQKNGIAVIRFDMSGLGESEGSLEEDYRLTNYLSDIDVVFQTLASQLFIDENAIGIAGHSMGGNAALLYAARNSQIRSVCAISAPYQLGDSGGLKKHLSEWKQSGWLERTSSRYGILSFPYSFIEDAMSHDVRKVAGQIKQPKLIVWGTADNRVFPSECEELYDFLHDPKESFVVQGMGHDYKRHPDMIKRVNKKVVAFFQKTL